MNIWEMEKVERGKSCVQGGPLLAFSEFPFSLLFEYFKAQVVLHCRVHFAFVNLR